MHLRKIGLGILAVIIIGLGWAQASDQAIGPIVTSASYSPAYLTGLPTLPMGIGVPGQGQPIYFTAMNGLYLYEGGSVVRIAPHWNLIACRFRPHYGLFVGDDWGDVFRWNVRAARLDLLARVNRFISGLDVDPANGDIYIVSSDLSTYLHKLKQGSSEPQFMGYLPNNVGNLAVVGNWLYLTQGYGGAILRMPKTGGAIKSVITGPIHPMDIVADAGGNLYFSDRAGGSIYAVKKGTTRAVKIASGFISPRGIGVDAKGNVYFIDHMGGSMWILRRSFS